jgi:hypothetical protein
VAIRCRRQQQNYVKYPIFLPDFNEIWFFSTVFRESPGYKISRKFFQWKRRWYMKCYGQIYGYKDIRTNRIQIDGRATWCRFTRREPLGAGTNKKYLEIRVECPKSLPHFKIICAFWADFNKILKNKASQKSVHSKPCWYTQTYGGAGRHNKELGAFHDYKNSPRNVYLSNNAATQKSVFVFNRLNHLLLLWSQLYFLVDLFIYLFIVLAVGAKLTGNC